VLQRGDFWMAFFLDDANEAEAVGTDVVEKAVAKGESDEIDVAQCVAQVGEGSAELGGPSRLMMGISGVRPDAAPESGRRRMLMVR
jgi:hypothetical protein